MRKAGFILLYWILNPVLYGQSLSILGGCGFQLLKFHLMFVSLFLSSFHSNAEGNWLSMRASIASRWTWLQVKISEMKYQIQQLTHLHSQLRNQKVLYQFIVS